MSLNGALQIGRSALTASQAALQVAGNNMANAATPGFHRRAMTLSPLQGELLGRGIEVGRGVNLTSVKRVVDIAMQSRHRLALSREHGAMVDQRFLRSLETIQNELTGNDLSSELSAFFNAFSELANNPTDNAVRAVVIQQGVSVADRISSMQREYGTVINEIDRSIGATIGTVNDLLSRIESVNQQIVITEPVAGEAASLRDQRDGLLDELSQYVDINVIEQSSGGIDIHIGSTPIFLGGASRGIELRQTTVGGAVETSIRVAADGTTLKINEGELGALMRQRTEHVNPAMETLDEFASQLIFQVNKLHGQGQPMSGQSSVSGLYGILDSTANLNASAAGLPFRVENGSFQIHVTHSESGARDATQIEIDGNAMSLDDLIAEINTNVPNVSASTGPAGELVLTASGGYELSFSDDTSGALAALGVNSFFSGYNASTIGVRKALISDPTLLAADAGHLPGSGGTALAITGLQEQAIDDLNGVTLRDFWRNHVNGVAVRTNAADNNVQSARLVKDNLNAQMQATSGVSLDEESINLLTFQRQFQAAARYISVIDDTLQTLLSMA